MKAAPCYAPREMLPPFQGFAWKSTNVQSAAAETFDVQHENTGIIINSMFDVLSKPRHCCLTRRKINFLVRQRKGLYAVMGFLLLGAIFVPANEPALTTNTQSNKVYSCIIHVHSKMSSSGRYSLPYLTEVARGYGIDAVFLTDNLTDTIQYGIPPLRHILWVNYSRMSVMRLGPRSYLDRIETENERQSDVLYVPGVEICPRFYWTGSLAEENLVCHDHQRDLIVLGITDARVLKKIPETCGYVWKKNPGWIITTRLLAALFVAACLAMLVMPRFLARRWPYSAREIRLSFVLGLILPLLAVMVAVNVAASLVPSFGIYGRDDSVRHEQRAIDFLRKHNLVHYWAHPEAFDRQEFKYAPSRYIHVPFKVNTEPYPELLCRTEGYTGFAGVYEDRNTLINPGSVWDQVLKEYADGRRDAPAWCFGEMLYHYEGQAGKKLGNVETMVWARERSAKALLESIREGHFYARRNAGGQSLVLDEWSVRKALPVEVVLHVSSRIPGEEIRIWLIRNGELLKEISGMTPVEVEIADHTCPRSGTTYYRAVVLGRYPLELVANPIFHFAPKLQDK